MNQHKEHINNIIDIIRICKGESLPIMETFYSLQGEGYNSGKPCYFIRLYGCDIGCHWCDVKESWPFKIKKKYIIEIHNLINEIKINNYNNIIITGGEPAIWDLNILTKKIKSLNKNIYLETSGAYIIKGKFDWICVSPKKNIKPLKYNLEIANELKCIIYNKYDFNFAEQMSKYVNKDCKLYMQPEWSKLKNTKYIIDYIKKNPKWILSLQTHKYINIR